MAEPITVEPRAAASPTPPAPAPTEATNLQPPAEGGVELPDDLLRIPAMQALVAGQPGAFSAILSEFEKDPAAKIIAKNRDALMKSGVAFYRSLDGAKGAVINSLFLNPEDVKAADQEGRLEEVAPPFNQLNASVAGSGANNPVLAEGVRPTGFAAGSGAPAAPMPSGELPKPLPAGAQKTLASKRAANMQPTSPTAGAGAGQGNLLRSVMRPVL